MKDNKNILKRLLVLTSVICVSVSLSLVVLADGEVGQVTANCGGGVTVQCDGYNCTATDYVGCSCKDKKGRVTVRNLCPHDEY